MEKPEYLGPMARSLVETFAGLTLPQQRRVFELLREILDENERVAALGVSALEAQPQTISDTNASANGKEE